MAIPTSTRSKVWSLVKRGVGRVYTRFWLTEHWRELAVIPPMYYITHCTSQIMAVTGARFTHVSCQGFTDADSDGAFDPAVNRWRNPSSNQAALFRMSDGSSSRVNVYWRVGHPSMVQMSMFGTKASFQYDCTGATWADKVHQESVTHLMVPGLRGPASLGWSIPRPKWLRRPPWLPSAIRPSRGVATGHGIILDVTALQPLETLPQEYAGLRDMGGEWGTNYFMVNEFVRACAEGIPPPNNVWAPARYTVPGIVAHESAMWGGELLEIPDFGNPPATKA